MENIGPEIAFLFKLVGRGKKGTKMNKKNSALEIYLNYCREYITNPDGLRDWVTSIGTVFIAKQFLFVTSGKDLCKYRMIQGPESLPFLQFVEKTSIHTQR